MPAVLLATVCVRVCVWVCVNSNSAWKEHNSALVSKTQSEVCRHKIVLLVLAGAQVAWRLAVQRVSQVHHGDFGVAVHGRDRWEQASFGQSAKRYAEKLKTPLEG